MTGTTGTSGLESLAAEIDIDEIVIAETALDADDGPWDEQDEGVLMVKSGDDVSVSTDGAIVTAETELGLSELIDETLRAFAGQSTTNVWRVINHPPEDKTGDAPVDYDLNIEVTD